MEKGKVLCIPMCTQGHVNYCITLGKRFLELYGDQADFYFAVDEEYKNKLEKISNQIKYIVYQPPNLADKKDAHWLIEMMQAFGSTWNEDAVRYIRESTEMFGQAFETLKASYPILSGIIKELKPDFLIFDQLFTTPVGIDQNIPYANMFSAAMNFPALSPKIPPPQSGLPTIYTPENLKKWEEFIEKAYKTGPFKVLKDRVNEFLREKNSPVTLDDHYFIYKASPFLNFYGYPKELDYIEDGIELPGKWVRIESPILKPYPPPYKIPEKLLNKPGKLIYFSLGSMATVYKPLMTKMLNVLSQLNHRFIVSTGLIGDQYTMAENMHGEKYVNQFSVLQTIDMIISHGGNNTLTESFTFGVPMCFVSLFGDQGDNAQRVQDKGLGIRCNIHASPEKLKQDLENAIEFCSGDDIKLKMKKISQRIQADSGLDKACEELFKFVKK